MSTIYVYPTASNVFWWTSTRPVEHRPAYDMRMTAHHLRGRNRIGANGVWVLEVVNTATGEVVMSDNGRAGLARAFEHTEFHTAVARCAWTTGVKQRSLRGKRRKGRAA